MYILVSCEALLHLHDRKMELKTKQQKSARKISSSSAELSYWLRDVRWVDMCSWWQAQNETAVCSKHKASRALTRGWTFWRGAGSPRRKIKKTEGEDNLTTQVGECSLSPVSVFHVGTEKQTKQTKKAWYQTVRVLQRKHLLCLAVRSRGLSSSSLLSFTHPRPPFLVGVGFASGVWLKRQLGQTVGGWRRTLLSPSYRLFCR